VESLVESLERIEVSGEEKVREGWEEGDEWLEE
jgi:hypothetical protein